MPTAANLNLYRGWNSCVGWHCDDEPLFGRAGNSKLIVSVSFGSQGRTGPVRTVKLVRAVLLMVTFRSWMANVRTRSFAAQIPVWNRSGLTLRAIGLSSILFLVHRGQELCAVHQRVRRVHLLLLWRGGGRGWGWRFWGNLGAPWSLVHTEGAGFASFLLVSTGLGLRRCAYRWTLRVGGGRWGHYLRDPWGLHWFAQKSASDDHGDGSNSMFFNAVCASLSETAQSPWLFCVYGIMGKGWHSGEIVGTIYVRPLFLVLVFFCVVETLLFGVEECLWNGRSRYPDQDTVSFVVEVFNVGGWVTHEDLVLDTKVDLLAVVEHRLILARVRSEWDRLRGKGLATVWAPATQDASHVGHAGVVVISFRGARVSLPTFATAKFKRFFFDCGRAVRCMLPLGCNRFLHLVVLHGTRVLIAMPRSLL